MQKNNEVELIVPTKWWQTLLSQLLQQLIRPSIFVIVILVFVYLKNIEYFKDKDPDWILDTISKFTNKASASASASVSIHYGDGDATVSRPFKDAIQACWYYHANYKNSHPYTLLWGKSSKEGVYPRIRVIADPAYWSAQNCKIEKGEVSLIGLEHTKHSIEAQFNESSDFVHVATGHAYYQSKLSFDHAGRITGRKVLESNFDCKFFGVFNNTEGKCVLTPQGQIKGKEQIQALKEKKSTFNDLEINPVLRLFDRNKVTAEEYVQNSQVINFYIKEREKLHDQLTKQGCGAISIEPKPEKEETRKLIETSIALLCFKETGSHVRLMQRTSEEIF